MASSAVFFNLNIKIREAKRVVPARRFESFKTLARYKNIITEGQEELQVYLD